MGKNFTNEEREVLKKFLDYAKEEVLMFRGIYDAKNGNENFMHGISTVFEYLATYVSVDYAMNYEEEFYINMVKSIKEDYDNE